MKTIIIQDTLDNFRFCCQFLSTLNWGRREEGGFWVEYLVGSWEHQKMIEQGIISD